MDEPNTWKYNEINVFMSLLHHIDLSGAINIVKMLYVILLWIGDTDYER